MNLVKYGIASVFVASATLLACGGSTDGGGAAGSPNGSAGASSSSAGANASSAGNKNSGGSTSMSGAGGTASGQAGGPPVASGGNCASGTVMDPDSQMCPAAVTCLQTKCQSEFDDATSTTGVCGSYIQCANACNCDDTCTNQCPQTSACQASLEAATTCVQQMCLNELLSCIGAGTGGTGGTGSGGKTCADLSTCCAALTDVDEKMQCTQVVALNTDLLCGIAYTSLCG